MIDPKALQKIVAAADLQKTDTVLEIGPGFGVLTEELIKRAGRVTAVELDRRLVEALRHRFTPTQPPPSRGRNNSPPLRGEGLGVGGKLTIIQADALKINNFGIVGPYKLVANIPYNITSALIRKFLEASQPPELLVLLVQKEVAERVCAKPGDMSLLSVGVQYYAKPEIMATVKAGCFWPKPKVDSAVLKITPYTTATKPVILARAGIHDRFFETVRAGFSAKRKQLRGNLARNFKVPLEQAGSWLLVAGISPTARAEELSVDQWKKLASLVNNHQVHKKSS